MPHADARIHSFMRAPCARWATVGTVWPKAQAIVDSIRLTRSY